MNFQPTQDNIAVMRHFFRQGQTAETIALEVGCAIRTAERWVTKFRREDDEGVPAIDRRAERVTPYKVTNDQLGQAVATLEQDPFMAASDLPALLDINVQPKTLRKSLKERANVHNFKAAKKPALRNADEVLRMNFADRYRHFTVALQWNRTFFLDEKTFSTEKDSRCRVWRPPNSRFRAEYVIPKSHSGRLNIACWGYITAQGPGALVEVGRRMNAEIYIQMLENWLLPGINGQFPDDRPVYIVEDNSPVHTAARVRAWYEAHPRLHRLVWAPRSPELNPIENVWAEIVRDWSPAARTEQELRERIVNRWEALRGRPNYFQTLAESMPRRIQVVMDSAGKGINY